MNRTRYEHTFDVTLDICVAVPGGTTRNRKVITREEIIRAIQTMVNEWGPGDVEEHIDGTIGYLQSNEISETGEIGDYFDSDDEAEHARKE